MLVKPKKETKSGVTVSSVGADLLFNLQVLRGLAALGVVFYHTDFRLAGDWHTDFSGVAIFFVISGFIMCFITRDNGFVQLDRTFHELSRQERDGDEFDFSEAYHVRGNLTWADLLKEYRTVILSEAGSGKTEEIRQAAKRLRAEGRAAFFLRLEHVPSNFDDAFEAGSIEEFEAWLKSEDESWLSLH